MGSFLKLFVNQNMAICFIGQTITALGQPAILNSVGKISAKWFKNNYRTLVTTILSVSHIIGSLVGYVFLIL